jgi:hypothetical protein
MSTDYKCTVVDAFTLIGGSGGCAMQGRAWEVTQTSGGITIEFGGLIFFMPDYISTQNFTTKN